MGLKYSLYPNHLTDDPDDHMAIVQDQTSRNIEDIVDRMINRGSTVTKADALSVIEEYESAIADVLSDGDSVNTPLMRISASIPGVFEDQFDSFDSSRHYVRLNVNPGPRISEIAGDIEVEKKDTIQPGPILKRFKDVNSDTTNETLSPGGVGEIRGSLLKLDPEEDDQGVFFIASDGTETRAETYIRNKPANLIFMIPDSLSSGEYEIEVRAILHNTKEVRSGRLKGTVVVP
jgi:hypothetical protein